jgi:hypothetical protein
VAGDLEHAEHPEHAEPADHHRPKNRPTVPVPRRWMKNRPLRMPTVGSTGLKSGDDLQALHRRQHRDGRGDHAVAVEQAAAKIPSSEMTQVTTRCGSAR